jgi:hypothetical protein
VGATLFAAATLPVDAVAIEQEVTAVDEGGDPTDFDI